MEQNNIWLKLALLNGIGNSTLHKIYNCINENSLMLDEIFTPSLQSHIFSLLSLRQQQVFLQFLKNTKHLEKLIQLLHKKNITPLFFFDKQYPKELKNTCGEKTPFVLFAYGNIALLKKKSIAIVGTRNPSRSAMQFTYQCTHAISQLNYPVVSGGAKGIDTAAHISILRYKGSTIFVLPYGILNYRNTDELNKLMNKGNTLILSEFHPLQIWEAGCAIARNKTIAGLSKAVIIVETGIKGGTQYTAYHGLKFQKPVFVLDFKDVKKQQPLGNKFLIHSANCIPLPPTAIPTALYNLHSIIKYNKKRIKAIQTKFKF